MQALSGSVTRNETHALPGDLQPHPRVLGRDPVGPRGRQPESPEDLPARCRAAGSGKLRVLLLAETCQSRPRIFENYCHHSKGKAGGQLVQLELWEKALLATIFGFIDIEGNRQYREAILIVGKKNGKSLLASGVGLYLQLADGEAGPEVYAVATKRDQAKIIWQEAKRMVQKSPALRKRTRCLVGEVDSDYNDGVFKPLSSDSDTLDGLNIHGAMMDEIHQWKNGRPLYDIIADGDQARAQPLRFITSTAGTIREDIYDEKYEEAERIINGYEDPDGYHDPRRIAFIYELDKRSEWTDPDCWKKANPGLGTIKSYTALKERVERAEKNPALVRNLVCKDFNIRETSSEAWLNFEQLDNRDTFQLDKENRRLIWQHHMADGKTQERVLSYPRYGIGGADLSKTTDLTAAKVLFQVPELPEILFVLQMYWLPQDLLKSASRKIRSHTTSGTSAGCSDCQRETRSAMRTSKHGLSRCRKTSIFLSPLSAMMRGRRLTGRTAWRTTLEKRP